MKPEKTTINLAISSELLEEFTAVCMEYGHAKQKGQVLSAAIYMFLKTDPEEQGQAMREIMEAEIDAGVSRMIDRCKKEQRKRIAARESAERTKRRPRKAAKKSAKRKARRSTKKK